MNNSSLFGICSEPEFVGCTLLDTIGLVIPSVDKELSRAANLPEDITAVGLISSRTGAAGQILAADEACKMTGCIPAKIELPRDTKGWGGHGNFIILGSRSVDDAKYAVELALEHAKRNAGEVYISGEGHLEFAFSSSAGPALELAFGATYGQAFGFIAASPAAIGFVLADRTLKQNSVKLLKYMSPSVGTSHSNEVIIAFSGETSDVKDAVISAREAGMKFLSSLGSIPVSPGDGPYII